MTGTPGTVLDAARSQLGHTDGTRYQSWLTAWTGAPSHNPRRWAAAFCAWALAAGGMDPTETGRYSGCTPWMAWFRSRGRLAHVPIPGSLVFYDWDQDGHPEHMGLVEGLHRDGRLITIEGDTDRDDGRGPRVARMLRTSRGQPGYGLPFYGPARPPPPGERR